MSSKFRKKQKKAKRRKWTICPVCTRGTGARFEVFRGGEWNQDKFREKTMRAGVVREGGAFIVRKTCSRCGHVIDLD